jgi:glycine oxidase
VTSPDVIVVGAGVLGLCTAAELAARGHAVTVVDPGLPNASSVAAGMIAPALESLLEDAGPARAALLRRARDLWPAFAAREGLTLHREGADWRGVGAEGRLPRLRELGFRAALDDHGLTTPDDWRVEPEPALERLAVAAGLAVLKGQAAGVSREGPSWTVRTQDGLAISAAVLVLATGAAPALPGLPSGVARRIGAIQPIKGQLTLVAVDPPGRVVRGPDAYVVPAPTGVVIGATMRPGERDLAPEPEVAERQVAAGLALLDRREAEIGETRVGVRGSTPDGLPLAGPSGEPGLFLALAPRRNGWLLGPMVARTVADAIEGRPAQADAAVLDPLRFP